MLMRQARLCFLHLLVVLWSLRVGGRAVGQAAVAGVEGGGVCSRVSFAVSWTMRGNQPWPCR